MRRSRAIRLVLAGWAGHPSGNTGLQAGSHAHSLRLVVSDDPGFGSGRLISEFDGRSVWQAWKTGVWGSCPPLVMSLRADACFDTPWKMVMGEGREGDVRLVQIIEDPREKQDVAVQHPEVVARLTQTEWAIPVGEAGRRKRNAEAMPNRKQRQNLQKRGGAGQPQSATGPSAEHEGDAHR